MFYKDNIISTSVSEAVEKVPADEKDQKCSFMCFTLHSHSIQRADQHMFFTYYDPSSVAKKITEDILHKIYTEKGAITGI